MSATLSYNYFFYDSTAPRNNNNLSAKRAAKLKLNEDSIFVTNPRISKSLRRHRNPSKNLPASTGPPQDFSLAGALRYYVDSGNMENAVCVFEKMNHSDPYWWNVLIRGFTDNGLFREAIEFYRRMESEGVRADKFTPTIVIKACGGSLSFCEGQKVHGNLFKVGLDLDVCVCNSLISMYSKLGYIEYAVRVFEEMPIRDQVSWNSMISGYAAVGDGWHSLVCFLDMQALGMKPDRFSMISALNACSVECFVQSGMEVHCQVLKCGFELDVMVQTSLLDMYNKCGHMDYAERLFDKINPKNTVAWNAMIGGYALNEQPCESFACFRKMLEEDNVNPDAVTMINLLPPCEQVGALLRGKSIHAYAIRKWFLPHVVLETALVNLYGSCGKPKMAERIFGEMAEKSLITWNAMIAANVQNELNMEAMELFQDLLNKPLKPDAITIASILPAYSEVARLREGKQIHGYIIKSQHHSNTYVLNATVFMYAKCGELETAQEIFDRILFKDVSSWNTIIMAYAIHGFGRKSIELFHEMRDKGIKPNESTFVSLLTSCSISGMVKQGWEFYNSMKRDYIIDPGIEHYGCILDLLGRTGNLEQAKNFIERMPLEPTARIWGSLLTASRNNKSIEFAELAAEHILSLEHDNTGCYVLLSNLYAEAGRWEDEERIKSLMKTKGLRKTIGWSLVETKCKPYRFINQDRSHIETNTIYNVLDILSSKMGDAKYVHNVTKFRPQDLLKKRANSPENHSVRLAICFGLISTKIGNPVIVRKNTRMCKDCHSAARKMSEITNREIIVGDSKAFHHFRNGNCTCSDYW